MDEFKNWPLTTALIDAYLEVASSLGSWLTTLEHNTLDEMWEHMAMKDKDRKEIEKPSKEEFMELITPIYKAKAIVIIRNKRNELLKESDWTQLADVNINKEEWVTYRQALRDITASLEIVFGKELKDYFPTSP